ncbi:hypothetical protein LCGC14_0565580 [marine sediment metagenome]|uniref:Uncharacterized protein n=1 Tax=marine sediment metagenome TaxID=412755 RepID=A0A0F9U722_9ZZZZ
MNVLRESFLLSYDECKRIRSPEQCRAIAASGASLSVDGYLRGYDLCVQTFGQERCRLMLSSPKTATVTVAVLAFVAGFVVGRLLK